MMGSDVLFFAHFHALGARSFDSRAAFVNWEALSPMLPRSQYLLDEHVRDSKRR